MLYEIAKTVHVIGVILLVGNVSATAIWKLFADRTGDPKIMAFAQKLVTYTDFSLTLWGIILIVGGGYAAALIADLDLVGQGWLLYGQLLFVVSGALWLGILLPLQIRQARAAKRFGEGSEVPEQYWRDCRSWIIWGLVATVPLVAGIWVMIAKPD
jgi:uncharacterized membrane protein